jgi:serine/threonine-protein kinase RsbW
MSAAVFAAEITRDLGRRMKFTEDALNEIELGVVEAVNNVVEHAYGFDAARQVVFTLEPDATDTTLTLTIRDQGRSMPEGLLERSAIAEIDEDDRENLPERGMGLALVKMTMDHVDYRTEEQCNVLTMVKRVSSSGTAEDARATS